MVGDGVCVHENGSCGGAVNFVYCAQCKCADPGYVCPTAVGSCADPQWLNDRYCDDGNNNCACNWDHGDWCVCEREVLRWKKLVRARLRTCLPACLPVCVYALF